MATLITTGPSPENLQRDHRFPPRRLSAFDRDEIELIANVARYHRRATPKKDHPGYGELPFGLTLSRDHDKDVIQAADGIGYGKTDAVVPANAKAAADQDTAPSR